MPFAGKIAFGVVALGVAAAMAAWVSPFLSPVRPVVNASPGPGQSARAMSFDARFLQNSASLPYVTGFVPPAEAGQSPSLSPEVEIARQRAKALLAEKLQAHSRQGTPFDGQLSSIIAAASASIPPSAPTTIASVPLPRSRPIEATYEAAAALSVAKPADRTLLQKLAELFPARVTLASLTPDDGLFGGKPDLAALGYDSVTAVYDISARAVYLPNGTKLEAHSGFGGLMDDPAHVNQRMVGATPPNVYDLKPREKLFHGVAALRMTPVGEGDTHGRVGLLVHNYMLGPNGDSNGCVSIKNYDAFLKAFQNGEVKRLVVLPTLSDGLVAARPSPSAS